ncbi:hypothetical protein TSAR_000753 [Trichomalopsis sarcophagae]|uniref:Uncharacterized protein n=1 Tax=Trichomalopsis sarcophagae TaxID=543379 RepID=A0A232F6D8_9HYME|nr:hypothetical protein TSAR_000753 [Trichomalopsis sarcophagae]
MLSFSETRSVCCLRKIRARNTAIIGTKKERALR